MNSQPPRSSTPLPEPFVDEINFDSMYEIWKLPMEEPLPPVENTMMADEKPSLRNHAWAPKNGLADYPGWASSPQEPSPKKNQVSKVVKHWENWCQNVVPEPKNHVSSMVKKMERKLGNLNLGPSKPKRYQPVRYAYDGRTYF